VQEQEAQQIKLQLKTHNLKSRSDSQKINYFATANGSPTSKLTKTS